MSFTSDNPMYYVVVGAVIGIFLYKLFRWVWHATRHWRL